MSNIVTPTPTKFVLKFDLSAVRPSVTCEATKFHSELIGNYKFSNVTHVKNLLVKHFIAAQNYKSHENKQLSPIWSYNVNTKSNTTTTTIYAAPSIGFLPIEGDLETMQAALTRVKISASFFDNQISKHLDSVGIKTTRANIRAYRESYKGQISKLLVEEILTKRSKAYITRWFDKLNGGSYFSLNLSSGRFAINVPMSYVDGNIEGLVIRALRLDWPRTMRARDVLKAAGISVVDLGYRTKGELYKAAFHI